jgi:nitroreductase
MQTQEAIRRRRSIRKFQPKKIPQSLLLSLVDAARLAPSAANLQPLEYIIIDDNEIKEKVFPHTKWAGYIAPEGTPEEGERPAAYILILVNRKIKSRWEGHDVGAAAQTILLLATSMGLGSCWLGAINRGKIRTILNIPSHYKVDSLIALGYPAQECVVEEVKDSIKYWKDEEGRIHVPKRNINDILHINKYGERMRR